MTKETYGWNVFSDFQECEGFYEDPVEALQALRRCRKRNRRAYILDCLIRKCSVKTMKEIIQSWRCL